MIATASVTKTTPKPEFVSFNHVKKNSGVYKSSNGYEYMISFGNGSVILYNTKSGNILDFYNAYEDSNFKYCLTDDEITLNIKNK